MNFDGVSPYVPGDDIRWMDWRATARTGSLQMKRFAAESHRVRFLVLDQRDHLSFGTRVCPMATVAALFAAQCLWEAFDLDEPFGLAIAPGGVVASPARGRRHLIMLLERIRASHRALMIASTGQTSSAASLVGAMSDALRLTADGDDIVVVSDFDGGTDALLARASHYAGRRGFTAAVIEDPIFGSEPPIGDYPISGPDRDQRIIARLSAAGVRRFIQLTRDRREALDRSFAMVDWKVRRISPRRPGSLSNAITLSIAN